MTRPRLLAATLTIAALVLTGCGSTTRPSDGGFEDASDDARNTVVDAANAAKSTLEHTYPDAGFIPEDQPGGPARSWDCSDSPAADGGAVQWESMRTWHLDSRNLTAPMLDPLVEQFTADGWQVSSDESDDQRLVTLERDGYTVEIAGDTQLNGEDPTRIRVAAYSPCLDNPDQ